MKKRPAIVISMSLVNEEHEKEQQHCKDEFLAQPPLSTTSNNHTSSPTLSHNNVNTTHLHEVSSAGKYHTRVHDKHCHQVEKESEKEDDNTSAAARVKQLSFSPNTTAATKNKNNKTFRCCEHLLKQLRAEESTLLGCGLYNMEKLAKAIKNDDGNDNNKKSAIKIFPAQSYSTN